MPLDNQLSNSLNNISSSNFLIRKRVFVLRERIYNQMFINESLALLKRSESLCSFRSSQFDFVIKMRAFIQFNNQLNSQFDSQITTNDEMNKKEKDQRRREKKVIKIAKTNRSRQQKKNKKSIKSKTKKKSFNLFIVQKDVIEVDSLSDEEMKIIIYKFNMKSF